MEGDRQMHRRAGGLRQPTGIPAACFCTLSLLSGLPVAAAHSKQEPPSPRGGGGLAARGPIPSGTVSEQARFIVIPVSGGGEGHGRADSIYLLTTTGGEGDLRRAGELRMRVRRVIVQLDRNGPA